MSPFSDKELQSLSIPVLVLIGDHDIINGGKSLEKARKLISNVSTETIMDAGHFLTIDQATATDERIMDFLNKK
jgi:pimeloyl-ACP methyl ester carboxylesterase